MRGCTLTSNTGGHNLTVYVGPNARDLRQRILTHFRENIRRGTYAIRSPKTDRVLTAKILPDPFIDPQLDW